MCTPCRQTCFSFTQVLLTFLLCSFLPLWIPKHTHYEGWKTKFLNPYYIQVLNNPILESLSCNEFHSFPRTFVKGQLQAWSKVVDKSHRTHICRAQQSESPTIITCKLHQSFIVGSSFYRAQNHKRSDGEEHWCNPLWRSKFQNFGGTIWNAIETPWWMMGGPHEWSHNGMHVSKRHVMASSYKWCGCNGNLTTTTHNNRRVLPPWHLLQQVPKLYLEQ